MSQKSPCDPSFDTNGNNNFNYLLSKFTEEVDYHAKTKILHSLVQAYLQCSENEFESSIITTEFLDTVSQIPVFCETFLQISHDFSISGNQCDTDLENKRLNIESASLCFDDLLACLEALCVTEPSAILIKIALNILSLGYTHCNMCEAIYGNLLEHFSNQLGVFFIKIESLQTVVLQQLDKLDTSKFAEDDSHIKFLILEMGNLCQIVFSLDADIAFDLWAKYLRFITAYKTLKDISNLHTISIYLATKNCEILESVKLELCKNSEQDKELFAQFPFYLDALAEIMNLVRDSSKGNISQFNSFTLILLDCLILCYSPFTDDKADLTIIKSSLVKNTFPLLSHLLSDDEFMNCVFLAPADKKHHLSVLLLKLCSLKFLQSSVQNKEKFVKDIFSGLLANTKEDDLKLLHCSVPHCSVSRTSSEELITLYQFAYETIKELLKCMPDSNIKELEKMVINSLISSSDVIYLLISDVWMYRLRCSTVEFLKDCCYTVLQNLHTKYINNDRIENFAKRMLKFLPCSYKDGLFDAFSSLRFIRDRKNVQHRFGIPDVSSNDNKIDIYSEEQIKTMMSQLAENSSNDAVNLVKKACTCLELCALFVNGAGCSEVLQFLEFASELFKTDVYEIQIAVLTLIKSLSRKRLPEHNQQFGEIISHLTKLFSEAMHSKNYIVKYEARNIFSLFANCTSHTKIIQETVKRDPTLKPIMKSYITGVPENGFSSEKETMAYLNEQVLKSGTEKIEIHAKSVEQLRQFFQKFDFSTLL